MTTENIDAYMKVGSGIAFITTAISILVYESLDILSIHYLAVALILVGFFFIGVGHVQRL
jgi:hypothetical protein